MDRPMVYFEDLEVGRVFPEYELVISKEIADKYFKAIEEEGAIADETGKRLLPPTIGSIFATGCYKKFVENPHGTLHTKQEYQMFHALYVGDTLKIQGTLIDKYEKKGHNYMVFKATAKKDNKICFISTATLLWGK